MSNTEETHDFYKDAQVLLESVLQELLLRVNLLRRYQMLAGERDPVEHCKGRIKSEDSMKEKLARKGLPITLDAALNEVHDAVGIRIVCQFVDDVYRMVDILKRQEDFILVKEKDFIKNPKPNGYRSYHMILEVPVFFSSGKTPMRVEVQVRTIAMDFWASLDHQLKYKKEFIDSDAIGQELKACADVIAETDEKMLSIRKSIESQGIEIKNDY